MINWLIVIGIIVTTFSLKVGVAHSFPNLAGLEDRQVKGFLTLCFSVVIILMAMYKNGFKTIENKPLLFLIGFLTLHQFIGPMTKIDLFGIDATGFWSYGPLLDIWLSFLLVLSIASYKFEEFNIKKIIKFLMWVAIIQAIYMIFQRLGLDPWQQLKQDHNSLFANKGNVSGTLTHPNFSSLYIAVFLPITIYVRKYWAFLVIILGLIAADSQVAYGVSFLCLWIYLFWNINTFKRLCLVFTTIMILGLAYYFFGKMIDGSGRFEVWELIWNDVIHPNMIKYSLFLTGYGLGSYKYIFSMQHKSEFLQAHNDYLELFYNVGIIGLIFLLIAIFHMFKHVVLPIKDEALKVLSIILIGLLASACFTFTLQMEPFRFMATIIIGILYSKYNNKVIQ